MKNRDYKEFTRGTLAHIYNRGNNKEKIFFDEQDYRAFLFRIALSLGFEVEEINKQKITQPKKIKKKQEFEYIDDDKKNIFLFFILFDFYCIYFL